VTFHEAQRFMTQSQKVSCLMGDGVGEQFEQFLKDLQESFWGDLYGKTRLAWKQFWEAQSMRERDSYMKTGWYDRVEAVAQNGRLAADVRNCRLTSRPKSLEWCPGVKRPRRMPRDYSKSIPPRSRVCCHELASPLLTTKLLGPLSRAMLKAAAQPRAVNRSSSSSLEECEELCEVSVSLRKTVRLIPAGESVTFSRIEPARNPYRRRRRSRSCG
jgi:hypothetical protein